MVFSETQLVFLMFYSTHLIIGHTLKLQDIEKQYKNYSKKIFETIKGLGLDNL